jgi:4-oxalocrotonate tautomerase
MNVWEKSELRVIAESDDLHISPFREDVGGLLPLASPRKLSFEPGDEKLNDRIDEAYRAKYKSSPYLSPMIGARARSATVRVMARNQRLIHWGENMPHVIVKLWPGKSEQQKTRLAEAITKDIAEILHYGPESVSVAMEEVRPQDWVERVYKPDVKNKWDTLYQKPGYDESDL